ncbi:MAG TPA: arginyltransferase [Dokdonella sp.]|uniref:arginyltransferase n=1 Tax=Dokdonella sp. TaxID=2291710 RepID=UPI002D7E3102|nr:arginyltransferase [Dokdonella sp.]HET9034044.1 arginyltransferase [Dokdonella sp.]
MRSDVVRLFQTLPHTCGYYAERTAQNLVIDPSSPHLDQLYEIALSRGYRRAGGHVYIPRCLECRACIACRIPVNDFIADRSQRRCLKRNADIDITVSAARYNDERFDLYQRYLKWRHPDGGMDDAQPDDFSRFLYTHWSPTRFIEFRNQGRLLAIAVTDFCDSGLSAVYTFYDPDVCERSLGTFAILKQIEIARQRGLAHVYLGFWIDGHPKMDYKMRFKPIEILRNGVWATRQA